MTKFHPLKFFDIDGTVSLFKYGSTLRSANASANRIHDYIVVINGGLINAIKWHRKFYEKYSSHYSKIALLGARLIALIQRSSKSYPIYYNSCILAEKSKIIKYGVISKDDLLKSLLNWSSLFIAGRFQKTIYCIGELDNDIKKALFENRKQAVRISLLLLYDNSRENKLSRKLEPLRSEEQIITFYDLFKKIISISYSGDIRFLIKNSFNEVCEKELRDSLPFLMEAYLPIISDYFEENKENISIENLEKQRLVKIRIFSKLITERQKEIIRKDILSGMTDELSSSCEWNSFHKFFFENEIKFKVNFDPKWRSREFLKLPETFTRKANKLVIKKNILNFLPINTIQKKYLLNTCPGLYLPWNPQIIEETIKNINLRCSLNAALANFLSNFGKIVSKTFYKFGLLTFPFFLFYLEYIF